MYSKKTVLWKYKILLIYPIVTMYFVSYLPIYVISNPTFFCRVVDLVLKTIMRVMWFAGGFHWVRIKGRQALPAEAPILTLAPHSSYFDAIPVTMTMASIVMKAESKDIPVWGSKFSFCF